MDRTFELLSAAVTNVAQAKSFIQRKPSGISVDSLTDTNQISSANTTPELARAEKLDDLKETREELLEQIGNSDPTNMADIAAQMELKNQLTVIDTQINALETPEESGDDLFNKEGELSAELWSTEDTFIPGEDEIRVLAVDAEGDMIVAIGEDGAIAKLEGRAGLSLIDAQSEVKLLNERLTLAANANVGANIEGKIELEFEPLEGEIELEVEAGVFIGASVGVDGKLDLEYVEIEGGIEGIKGIALQV